MKPNILQWITCLSLASVFFIFSHPAGAAEYKNRLSILPFENPDGWAAPYHPGELIHKLLERSLSEDKKFHLLKAPSQKITKPDAMKNLKTRLNHPIQYILRGRVLIFTAGQPPSRAQLILNIGDAMKQKAEVEIEMELINHHIGNSVDKKRFRVVTSAGTVPFDIDASAVDFDSGSFQKSSIGKAMFDLNRQINSYVLATLHPLPLEGEIISVNLKDKEVIINVGHVHGIDFGDSFNVYSVTLQYKDPFTHMNLGNRFTRRGVIRVKHVQEGFSIASIVAGDGFEMGELVRSRKTNPVFFEPKVSDQDEQFP